MIRRRRRSALFSTLAVLCGATGVVQAQGWGPSPVGVTPARSTTVQAVVQLPGTVEARTSAVVASDVPGVVDQLLVREGDLVERGAVLARLLKETVERDLEAAQAQLAEAQARLELAERALERAVELRDSGVISVQQFDDAETEVGAWKGRADQARALIARLQIQIERSVVRAPFSGVVVREHCEQGEWVAQGGAVVELIDPRRLEVVVNVPERHFAGAKRGARARVTFDSLPHLDVDGSIRAVVPVADPQARTFPVKVEISNPDRTIGVGMSASVAFPSGAATEVVVVPKDAIVSEGAERLVYVVAPGPPGEDGSTKLVAQRTPVVLGASIGDWVEARGLEAGTEVVTRGNERLAPGAELITEPVEYPEP